MGKRLGLLGLSILMFVLTGCGSVGTEKLNVDDYVEVRVDGLNEEGVVFLTLHDEPLAEIMLERIGYSIDQSEEVYYGVDRDEAQKIQDIMDLLGSVVIKSDKSDGLVNGDKLNISLEYDEELAKKMKYKLEFTRGEHEVLGLEDAVVLDFKDVFDYVKVSYFGVSPDVKVQIENTATDDINSRVQFRAVNEALEDIYTVKEGDTFKVLAEVPKEDLEYEGYRVTQDTFDKEFTVDKVDKYISGYSEITVDAWKEIIGEFTDKARAEIYPGSNYYVYDNERLLFSTENEDVVGDIKVTEGFLLMNKYKESNPKIINQLTVVFEVNIHAKTRASEVPVDNKVYFALYTDDLILDKNGEMVFTLSSMGMTNGELNINTLRNEMVTQYLSEYKVEEITADYIMEQIAE